WAAAHVRAAVDERLRHAVQQRAGGRGALIVEAGLEPERAREIVDRDRELQQVLRNRHLLGVRARAFAQAVHVVAALLALEPERAADADGQLVAAVRAADRAREAVRLV